MMIKPNKDIAREKGYTQSNISYEYRHKKIPQQNTSKLNLAKHKKTSTSWTSEIYIMYARLV